MKIAFDARCLLGKRTGVGRYLLNLIKRMSSLRGEIEFNLFVDESIKKVHFGDKNNISIKKINAPNLLWKNIRLPFALMSDKAHLVHLPSYTIPFWAPCPTIVTIHDVIFAFHPEWCSKKQHIRFKHLVRLSAKKANAIIVVSNSTKKELLDLTKISEDKIYLTYLAADEIFKPNKDPLVLENLRQKYNFKEDYILHVGSLHPRRNIERIINAFSHLKKEIDKKIIFILVGQWFDKKNKLNDMAKKLNIINYIKHIDYVPDDDLVKLYNFADLFIYPSLYEGFGLPVLEAMACGTPVITSNISSLPEITGDAAFLVDPYNVYEMKEAMKSILLEKELHSRLIEKGFKKIKNYTWNKAAEKTLEIYKNVIKL
jgi:glycosyltransferase involved in cell wall biosynthesis